MAKREVVMCDTPGCEKLGRFVCPTCQNDMCEKCLSQIELQCGGGVYPCIALPSICAQCAQLVHGLGPKGIHPEHIHKRLVEICKILVVTGRSCDAARALGGSEKANQDRGDPKIKPATDPHTIRKIAGR